MHSHRCLLSLHLSCSMKGMTDKTCCFGYSNSLKWNHLELQVLRREKDDIMLGVLHFKCFKLEGKTENVLFEKNKTVFLIPKYLRGGG